MQEKSKEQRARIETLLSLGFEKADGFGTIYRKGDIVMSADSQMTPKGIREAVRAIEEAEAAKNAPKDEKPQEEPQNGESVGDVFKEHTEEVEPTYIAEEVAEVLTPVFFRLTLDGERYYYRAVEGGDVRIYASGTNLIKDGYADDKTMLEEWKGQLKMLGKDPVAVAEYEADKGTIMHYLYGLYLMGREFVLSRSFIRRLVKEAKITISGENRKRFLESDDDVDNMIQRMVRFAKFCSDYKVEPILIEKILSCEKYCVASPIDLVCRMTEETWEEGYFGATYQRDTKDHKKGEPKLERRKKEDTYFAIIDFKSGGIWPKHALQLELYRRMVAEWYGELLPIRKIFNFSPKSESSKGYTLRDQTASKEIRKADAVFEQGAINHSNKDKVYKTYEGRLSIGTPFDEARITRTYVLQDELKRVLSGTN